MSEAMAVERMVEEWLRFQGHWTQTRVPFKKPRGGNSDINVIGANLQRKRPRVVVVEVKGHGSPSAYPDYTSPGRARQIEDLCKKEKRSIKQFLHSPAAKHLGVTKVDELRLVEPGRLGPLGKRREDLEHTLRQKYRLPFELRIVSIDEVIKDLFKRVTTDKDERRKRYADTALEMIRWITRAKGQIEWSSEIARAAVHTGRPRDGSRGRRTSKN